MSPIVPDDGDRPPRAKRTRARLIRGLTQSVSGSREAFQRTVDRAERERLARREEQLRYVADDEPTAERSASPSEPPAVGTIDEETARADAATAADAQGSPSGEGSSPQAAASTAALAEAVSVPSVVRTRSTVLDSLPGWLVRGGLGAWLVIGLVIVLSMIVFATSKVIPVFIGVFLALLLTAILEPGVRFFSRVMPRFPATFLALLLNLAVLVGLVTYVVTSVTSQWNRLALQFSDGVNTIIDFLENGPLPVHLTQAQLASQIQKWTAEGQQYLQSNAGTLAGEVAANAGTVFDVFAVLALAVFTTIFFLASGGRMWRWFLNELPARHRESVHRAAGAGWYTFAGYARGTVIVAFTDGVMAGIFLQIVGVPLAAPLAVLVFIGAFIPIIGAPTAMVIAMIVALAAKGFVTMVVVGLGVAGIGQIEGHILQPLIMGRQVSLHPVVVLIGVAIGTYAAGLLGAIIAVPLVSVAWSVYSELHTKDAPVIGDLPVYESDRRH